MTAKKPIFRQSEENVRCRFSLLVYLNMFRPQICHCFIETKIFCRQRENYYVTNKRQKRQSQTLTGKRPNC